LAGKFLNTDMKVTVDSLVQGVKGRLDNPFYIFIDKSPTVVTYYNPNIDVSTLDESTKQIYESVGPQSGLRFNKINDVFLYGMEKIQLDIDMGEWGPESSPIEGEVILPPNTFTPYQEGYFVINHLGKNIFFRVVGVNIDTLENGNNFYKLTYKLDNFDLKIEAQVINEFNMVASNIGSDLKSVVINEEYKFIESIQNVTSILREYFNSLFFKHRVQTYIFAYGDVYFYDPYMIEFIIRNGILDYGRDKYSYITQQVYLPQTFCIEYDKTIFRCLEQRNNKTNFPRAYGVLITDPTSLLTTRMEDYFMIDYKVKLGVLADPIDILDADFIDAIMNGKTFEVGNAKEYYNIISSYFNKKDITQDMINALEQLEFSPGVELFYTIPMVIFVLEKYAIDLLKTDIKRLV
jgi:hypothetical protein